MEMGSWERGGVTASRAEAPHTGVPKTGLPAVVLPLTLVNTQRNVAFSLAPVNEEMMKESSKTNWSDGAGSNTPPPTGEAVKSLANRRFTEICTLLFMPLSVQPRLQHLASEQLAYVANVSRLVALVALLVVVVTLVQDHVHTVALQVFDLSKSQVLTEMNAPPFQGRWKVAGCGVCTGRDRGSASHRLVIAARNCPGAREKVLCFGPHSSSSSSRLGPELSHSLHEGFLGSSNNRVITG